VAGEEPKVDPEKIYGSKKGPKNIGARMTSFPQRGEGKNTPRRIVEGRWRDRTQK